MGFFADFKKFLLRGNVVDLAVGVIIGAAFGGITKSMVDDVMMPPLGLAMGAVDFKDQYIPLPFREPGKSAYESLRREIDPEVQEVVRQNEERKKKGEPAIPEPEPKVKPPLDQMIAKGIPTLRYGLFINTVINFLFVAFGVFLIVKLVSTLQKKPGPPDPSATEKLLAEIRDTLKGQKKT